MKISYIITTACGDPYVSEQHGGGGLYKMTMSQRAELLDKEILPWANTQNVVDDIEIIIVGRYPEQLAKKWDGFQWLYVPPERRDRIEAFRQREIAARWSTGDILIVSADDHRLDEYFVEKLREIENDDWDLITPKRLHAKTNELLNNGRDEGYSPWHTQVLRRSLWAQVPFTLYDTLWVDIVIGTTYESIGAKMIWSDDLVVYDCEAEEDEA
jgi:hypothetical protein